MKFLYPSYLFLLLGTVPLFLIMVYWHKKTHSILSHVYSQDYLIRARLYKVVVVKIVCVVVLYFAIVFGIAAPEVARVDELEEDAQNKTLRIMLIDVSKSMYAVENGVKRIELVTNYLHNIVNTYDQSLYVIYVFTDRLSKIVPATESISFVHKVLSTLAEAPVLNGSTDFTKVVDQLQNSELEEVSTYNTYSHMYLYFASDGESHTATSSTLFKKIASRGITPIFLLGGTTQGVQIPAQEGYVIDKTGEIAMSYANPTLLQSFARAADGEYINLNEYNELSNDFRSGSGTDTVQLAWIGWMLASVAMCMYALTLI